MMQCGVTDEINGKVILLASTSTLTHSTLTLCPILGFLFLIHTTTFAITSYLTVYL